MGIKNEKNCSRIIYSINLIYAYIMWKALYRRVAIIGGIILSKRNISIKRVIKIRRKFKNLHWNKEIDIAKNS